MRALRPIGAALLLALGAGCGTSAGATREDPPIRHPRGFELPLPEAPPAAPRTARAPAERGIASWYGAPFHGRTTASGRRYDMHELTAAHPKLKFGTRCMVTNLHNNRTIYVEITDRGPYVHGRIIDLSHAAARTLGMLHAGLAPVEIEVVD